MLTNQPTNQPTNQLTNPVKPGNTTTQSNPTGSTGAAYVGTGQDAAATFTYKTLNNANNLNVIVVDGKEVRVAYQDKGIYSGTWARLNGVATCCGKYSDVRFGVVEGKSEKDAGYLFYNGKPTQNVPTSGAFSYNGHFVVSSETAQFEDNDHLFGEAKFDVDFGGKKLQGTLTEKTLKPISVSATINGNSFAGEASSADFNSKAALEGKFFGTGAKELGGIFSDKKTWGGAFGAAR